MDMELGWWRYKTWSAYFGKEEEFWGFDLTGFRLARDAASRRGIGFRGLSVTLGKWGRWFAWA